jgi:hypothetical protein
MFNGFSHIIKCIRHYYLSVFNFWYFLLIMALLGAIIYANYFQTSSFDSKNLNGFQKLGSSYLLYFLPFAAAYSFQYFFYKNTGYFRNKWFWTLVIVAPAFFSFRVNFNFHQSLVEQHWQGPLQHYWLSAGNLIVRALVLLFPVGIIWWLKDRHNEPFYGLTLIKNIQPYFIMLLCMLPLVIWASNDPAFLKQYPVALKAMGATMPFKKIYGGLYELFYALDFFSIECFFRGFLILAFIRIAGMHAIVPAACFYCCIHLGKPMPEAISSFFGALLLGIFSYHNRSIWGGLIIHIGIAWFMEIAAFLQHQ